MSSSMELFNSDDPSSVSASMLLDLPDEANSGLVEEEELTADEVLQRLQEAWMNEMFAPELLEPQVEVVDCLMEQMARKEEFLCQLESGNFAIAFLKMELQRIRYLISSYLRLRLEKIQKHVFFLLSLAASDPEHFNKMTKEEVEFARNFRDAQESLFKEIALGKMPGKLAEFDTLSSFGGSLGTPAMYRPDPALPGPNLNATVIVKAVENVTGVIVEDDAFRGRDEELDLIKGSQHILRYNSVRNLLHSGSIKLI